MRTQRTLGLLVTLEVWLVGQTAFVGLSAFQPAYLLVAAAIATLGRRLAAPARRPPARALLPGGRSWSTATARLDGEAVTKVPGDLRATGGPSLHERD